MLSPTRVYYNRKVEYDTHPEKLKTRNIRSTNGSFGNISTGTATSEEEQELSQWSATSEKHRREVAELRAGPTTIRKVGVRPSIGPARFIRSLNRLNSRIDALENAPCTAQRPHRLSNLFGHIRIHSLLPTAAVVAVVALTGMFAWRTALMPAPITYFNADTTIMHVAMPDGSDIWRPTRIDALLRRDIPHRRTPRTSRRRSLFRRRARRQASFRRRYSQSARARARYGFQRPIVARRPHGRDDAWPKAPYHCSAPTAAI